MYPNFFNLGNLPFLSFLILLLCYLCIVCFVSSLQLQIEGLQRHPKYGARIENQTYKSMLHAFREIVAKEGFAGLYKGIFPSLVKSAPAGAVTFVAYEYISDWLESILTWKRYIYKNFWPKFCFLINFLLFGFVSFLHSLQRPLYYKSSIRAILLTLHCPSTCNMNKHSGEEYLSSCWILLLG